MPNTNRIAKIAETRYIDSIWYPFILLW